MKVKRIGLDLAKNVFELHRADESERVVLRKTPRRNKVLSLPNRPLRGGHGGLW